MEYYPCPIPSPEDCPYKSKGACREDTHHLYWPAEDYKTPTEKVFRNLPENKWEMCRYLHEIEHKVVDAPEKPEREAMVDAIALSGISLSATKQRNIYGTAR